MKLTADRLRELLHYDADTGVFTWINPPGMKMRRGALAGSSSRGDRGYVVIGIGGRRYRAHRLAWLYATGEWPTGEIDHLNGQRNDNRFANLRDVTHSLNTQNLRAKRDRTRSGLLGAQFRGRTRRWRAQIRIGKVRYELGEFDTPEEAHAAYLAAKRKLHEGCTI